MNENSNCLNFKRDSASLAAHAETTIDKKHKGERNLCMETCVSVAPKHFYTRDLIETRQKATDNSNSIIKALLPVLQYFDLVRQAFWNS